MTEGVLSDGPPRGGHPLVQRRHGLLVLAATLLAAQQHGNARALRAFNDKVVNDPRVVCVLTTIRDGVTLIRRAA